MMVLRLTTTSLGTFSISAFIITSASAVTLSKKCRENRFYTEHHLSFLTTIISCSLPTYLRIQFTIMSAAADVKLEDFSSIFSLKGKVAVVTGGSRGLGLHAASG
jgi:hypothetical protein